MAGNGRLAGLTQPQQHDGFGGRFLMFKSGAPTDGTSGDLMPRAALCINIACTDGDDWLYYNEGTEASPTWQPAIGDNA